MLVINKEVTRYVYSTRRRRMDIFSGRVSLFCYILERLIDSVDFEAIIEKVVTDTINECKGSN